MILVVTFPIINEAPTSPTMPDHDPSDDTDNAWDLENDPLLWLFSLGNIADADPSVVPMTRTSRVPLSTYDDIDNRDNYAEAGGTYFDDGYGGVSIRGSEDVKVITPDHDARDGLDEPNDTLQPSVLDKHFFPTTSTALTRHQHKQAMDRLFEPVEFQLTILRTLQPDTFPNYDPHGRNEVYRVALRLTLRPIAMLVSIKVERLAGVRGMTEKYMW